MTEYAQGVTPSPTVEEVLNHENSEDLILTHVRRIECPSCGNRMIVSVNDGWTDHFLCDNCGEELEMV